jgi:hypothetical protein
MKVYEKVQKDKELQVQVIEKMDEREDLMGEKLKRM